MAKILVIEDSESISNLICINLSVVGYETKPVFEGNAALEIIESGEHFDLALVDIMLPGIDGFELMRPLDSRNIPVIYLTAKNDIESKVRGLKGGAEDYIVKPFEVLELLVRIEKVLKRCGNVDTTITVDDLEILTDEHMVKQNGRTINLKPREFDFLVLLAKNKNVALSRERILAEVWGMDFMGETRTVDVHIAQLRRKTGLNIQSVPKVGYRLEERR
ncbi:response regulator transcription factor [Ruminococcus sp. OA3]|uniref:response regulator transcription factor n=1 Tax=Ruminococcus sp. OA3 TaxID=2914164 RepID=UPI001F0636F6|nr:response regulator transcription factor [Ruminococcus sp. OA3]MCH1981928.1 response regulator transcription factor [Ruminococcus sp. OA3]